MVSLLYPNDLFAQVVKVRRFIGKVTSIRVLSCDSVIDGAFFSHPDFQVPKEEWAIMHVSIWWCHPGNFAPRSDPYQFRFVSSKHCSIAHRKPLSQKSVFSLLLDEALLIKKLYFGSSSKFSGPTTKPFFAAAHRPKGVPCGE